MDESDESGPQPDTMKRCPYCAEWIKAEAIMCRYCGHDTRVPVPPASDAASARDQSNESQSQPQPPPRHRGTWRYAIPAALLIALVAVYPRVANFPSVLEDAAAGRASIAFLRGYERDIAYHFVTNWLLWTLAIAAIIAGWRVARGALMLLLGLVILAAALLLLSGRISLLIPAHIPSSPWQPPTSTPQRQPTSTPGRLPTSTSGGLPTSTARAACTCPLADAEYLSTLVPGQTVCLRGDFRLDSVGFVGTDQEYTNFRLGRATVHVVGRRPFHIAQGAYAEVTGPVWSAWNPSYNQLGIWLTSWDDVTMCP